MTTEAAIVLHAYQPPYPIQIPEVVKRITQRTYLPFAKAVNELETEGGKVVLNMNGCLTRMLRDESSETISLLAEAMEKGNLELVDSGYFHPILPFIQDDPQEFAAQINENRSANTAAFGLSKNPIGFWPPELAVSYQTAKMLVEMGYKAIMAPANILKERKRRTLYGVKSGRSHALMLSRDRNISNCISFRRYNDDANAAAHDICAAADWSGTPILLAMDLETFGEHHQNYLPFLFRLLSHKSLKWIGLSDLVAGKYHVEYIDNFASSSWSTEDGDRDRDIPFPLWHHPQNPIHQTQQAHMGLLRTCVKMLGGIDQLAGQQRLNYMAAQHSCQFWWAGLGYMFSPDMVSKGFQLQMKSLSEVIEGLPVRQRTTILEYSESLKRHLAESIRTH